MAAKKVRLSLMNKIAIRAVVKEMSDEMALDLAELQGAEFEELAYLQALLRELAETVAPLAALEPATGVPLGLEVTRGMQARAIKAVESVLKTTAFDGSMLGRR